MPEAESTFTVPESLRHIRRVACTIETIRVESALTHEQIGAVLSELHAYGLLREDETYNGWINYETWCVHLWLTSEQRIDRHCRSLAREAVQAASDCEQVREEIWTEADARKFLLADAIKEFVEELNPLASQASVFSDLLGTAIHEADWHEIAEAFLSED